MTSVLLQTHQTTNTFKSNPFFIINNFHFYLKPKQTEKQLSLKTNNNHYTDLSSAQY